VNAASQAATTVLPGNTGVAAVIAPLDTSGGYAPGGVSVNVERTGATLTSAAPTTTVITTPLLDAATRDVEARTLRQRARGEQPRVIGIAPRTDNDRTDQMPDDRIIRY
jgi:hypothetical protein